MKGILKSELEGVAKDVVVACCDCTEDLTNTSVS